MKSRINTGGNVSLEDLKGMKCSCGGTIEVIIEGGYISHGVCDFCLKGIVLPQEKIK